MAGTEGRALCHDDDDDWQDESGDQPIDITTEAGRSKLGPFRVRSVGPEGSGRYWTIDVALDLGGASSGFCLSTSTVGWRQVYGSNELANELVTRILRVQDADGDGVDEFVLPSSFELGQSLSETAITATAFERTSDGMQLDRTSTNLLRTAIAKSYRRAADLATTSARHKTHYRAAAEFLDQHSCGPE